VERPAWPLARPDGAVEIYQQRGSVANGVPNTIEAANQVFDAYSGMGRFAGIECDTVWDGYMDGTGLWRMGSIVQPREGIGKTPDVQRELPSLDEYLQAVGPRLVAQKLRLFLDIQAGPAWMPTAAYNNVHDSITAAGLAQHVSLMSFWTVPLCALAPHGYPTALVVSYHDGRPLNEYATTALQEVWQNAGGPVGIVLRVATFPPGEGKVGGCEPQQLAELEVQCRSHGGTVVYLGPTPHEVALIQEARKAAGAALEAIVIISSHAERLLNRIFHRDPYA